jgi:hypothetical protein
VVLLRILLRILTILKIPARVTPTPIPKHISTSRVECQNLGSYIARRYTRPTNAFRRKLDNHAAPPLVRKSGTTKCWLRVVSVASFFYVPLGRSRFPQVSNKNLNKHLLWKLFPW